MAKNNRSNQQHKGHDNKSIGQGDSLLTKNKWDKNQRVVFF